MLFLSTVLMLSTNAFAESNNVSGKKKCCGCECCEKSKHKCCKGKKCCSGKEDCCKTDKSCCKDGKCGVDSGKCSTSEGDKDGKKPCCK